jgi:hypothetical protein
VKVPATPTADFVGYREFFMVRWQTKNQSLPCKVSGVGAMYAVKRIHGKSGPNERQLSFTAIIGRTPKYRKACVNPFGARE